MVTSFPIDRQLKNPAEGDRWRKPAHVNDRKLRTSATLSPKRTDSGGQVTHLVTFSGKSAAIATQYDLFKRTLLAQNLYVVEVATLQLIAYQSISDKTESGPTHP